MGERRTVLVVEDDELILEYLREVLTDGGYSVVQARCADEALPVLEARVVHLVFADIVLPGRMSGLDLSLEISRRYPRVPVICASGYPLRGGREGETVRPDGCAMFLRKPFRTAELLDAVHSALLNGPERLH